jgi:hypothetical protein
LPAAWLTQGEPDQRGEHRHYAEAEGGVYVHHMSAEASLTGASTLAA